MAQESIIINGSRIWFPFKPYRSQLILMNRLINALDTGQNCLLESPTGTGKTLALLCACIAWIQKSKTDPSSSCPPNKKGRWRILYGTRTHRQIDQIIDQLRRTEYSKDRALKMAILASRDHTCIHPHVSKMDARAKDEECRRMTVATGRDKTQDCRYDNNRIKGHLDVWSSISSKRPLDDFSGKSCVFDVSEMVQVGKRLRCCPFYALRALAEQSDLILCPYNFLLDPRIRSSVPAIVLDKQTIVIFDEAHNIDDLARDALSFLFVRANIEMCLSELGRLEAEISSGIAVLLGVNQSPGDVMNAVGFMSSRLKRLSEWMLRIWLSRNVSGEDEQVLNCLEVMVAIKAFGLDGTEAGTKAFAKAMRVLCEGESGGDRSDERGEDDGKGDVPEKINLIGENGRRLLGELSLLLQTLYLDDMKHVNDYSVILKPFKLSTPNSVDIESECVQFLCLNAQSAFRAFRSVRSLIVSSGTLAPLLALENEIGIEFGITAETDHVVPASQVFVAAVDSVGLEGNNRPLRCTYAQSSSFAFQDDLGCLILSICEKVRRGGVLCFLPSYRLLDALRVRWTLSGTWNQLENSRRVLVEPRADRAFSQMLAKMKTNSDFVLFAVFRGRASEGIDFADDMARCVICVGLPYPNIKEIGIDLKMKYNDKNREALLPGSEWYEIQAFRALNQALGRCLRHKNDWGSIVLIDERFTTCWNRYKNNVSSWIRSKVGFYRRRTEEFLSDLENFNKRLSEKALEPVFKEENSALESKAFMSLFDEKSTKTELKSKRKRRSNQPKKEFSPLPQSNRENEEKERKSIKGHISLKFTDGYSSGDEKDFV